MYISIECVVQVYSTIVLYQCANIGLKVKMQIGWRIGGEDTKLRNEHASECFEGFVDVSQ